MAVLRHVQKRLRDRGFDVLPEEILHSGQEWRASLYHGLAECSAAVLLLNASALRSRWVHREVDILMWRRSLGSRVTVVPALLGVSPGQVRAAELGELAVLPYAGRDIRGSTESDAAEVADEIVTRLANVPSRSGNHQHVRERIDRIANSPTVVGSTMNESAIVPPTVWWNRASAAGFIVAGVLFALAGLVDREAVTWDQLGRQIGRIPWFAVGCSAAGALCLAIPAIQWYRERSRRIASTSSMRVIRWWVILAAAGVVGIATWAGTAWLLSEADRSIAAEKPKARIDAIRTGLSIGAGTGGAVALLLAARRQWLNELGHAHQEKVHAHQERVAAAGEHDAAERRITELYTKAVEQLGHNDAAVRLGGLYSLERLGQGNVAHRQTIIDVICAYLRMPPPEDEARPREKQPPTISEEARPRKDPKEEQQVRGAAQGILIRHLNRPPDLTEVQGATFAPHSDHSFWPGQMGDLSGHSIDLNGAYLVDFGLPRGWIATAIFNNATFAGGCSFDGAVFSGGAWFDGATFPDKAWFGDVRFNGTASFTDAIFRGDTWFGDASFFSVAFNNAAFSGDTSFGRARFSDQASFDNATFSGDAWFGNVEFAGQAWFGGATFIDDGPDLTGAWVSDLFERHSWPAPWTVSPDEHQRECGRLVRAGIDPRTTEASTLE